MKFFHLSDLHIGLKLMNRDLREDQEFILNQIVELAKEQNPDAIVIAGDIYDKAVPSAEAVEVFDGFVSSLRVVLPEAHIMMISGNHDSAPRVNVFRSVLRGQNIHMIGIPPQTADEPIEQVTLQDSYGPVHFYLLPFVRPSMMKPVVGTDESGNTLSYDETVRRLIEREDICEDERNVLVSHQFYLPAGTDPDKVERMDSEVRTIGNIDEVRSDILERFDYAALGHIHKPMQAGTEHIRYCGTPIACSVSEAGQEKAVLCVELNKKGNVQVRRLPLSPLHQVKVIKGSLEEACAQGCDDYVTVVLTDSREGYMLDTPDRLRAAFPNLLEIRRQEETVWGGEKEAVLPNRKDPFTLCKDFLQDLTPEEEELLKEIINSVGEVDS